MQEKLPANKPTVEDQEHNQPDSRIEANESNSEKKISRAIGNRTLLAAQDAFTKLQGQKKHYESIRDTAIEKGIDVADAAKRHLEMLRERYATPMTDEQEKDRDDILNNPPVAQTD